MLKTLIEAQIPKKITLFIANIMLNRTLLGYLNGTHIGTVNTNTGCPQGSVLSPLLFNLYIAKMNHAFTHEIKVLGFADDINFYATHTKLEVLLDIL